MRQAEAVAKMGWPLIKLKELPAKGEQAFARSLARRLDLRIHVSLIIAFAWCCGFVVTWGLHHAGIGSMAVRYAVALIVVYAAFLAGVRLWIWYVFGPVPRKQNAVSQDDRGDSGWRLPSSGGGSSVSAPRGGGGRSGGAGASGSWDDASPRAPAFMPAGGTPADVSASHASVGSSRASSSSSSGGSSSGGGDHDGGGALAGLAALLVRVFFILVVIAFCASIGYVVYIGPEILGDAAFQFLLAAGLLKHSHRDGASWTDSVIRATWKPFAIVFAIMLGFALVAGWFYPDAHTMHAVLRAAGWF